MAPTLDGSWTVGVLVGPHAAPEFLTPAGLEALLRAEWEVHFNSARTGVRLVGPKPDWARPDGGDAGLHPSNIHDTGYALGAVDLTGDMPVVLGPDGPSLGGFVCPAVVVASERWKLGQMRPGDRVRLVAWSADEAERAGRRRAEWLRRATVPVEPLARPVWNRPSPGAGRRGPIDEAVLARRDPGDGSPAVTYRRAGDRFLLVEYGEMALDLELRLRVHALDRWVASNLGDGRDTGLVDATAGVRSLLVQVDGDRLTVAGALAALRAAEPDLGDEVERPVPARVVHLPLSWDDPATREATLRYMHGVRADAPWCPWNIEFIRRINGLATPEDVRRIVFDASYLVLGLGDVYLGAPVATPLDPRHRLVTTKYNPARTWTAENSVGIGGAYLCIYGMEGPGGYQFVGRTVQVWNRHCRGPHFDRPWLLRPFDQLRWFPVEADELLDMRARHEQGELDLRVEEVTFRLGEHRRSWPATTRRSPASGPRSGPPSRRSGGAGSAPGRWSDEGTREGARLDPGARHHGVGHRRRRRRGARWHPPARRGRRRPRAAGPAAPGRAHRGAAGRAGPGRRAGARGGPAGRARSGGVAAGGRAVRRQGQHRRGRLPDDRRLSRLHPPGRA